MNLAIPNAGLNERDGILINSPDNPGSYRAWLRVSDVQKMPDDKSQGWVFICIEPRNYPVLFVRHFEESEDNIVKHIINEFEGWQVMKANVGGLPFDNDGII